MDYLICQDWGSTSGNHAGMKYLCEELQKRYPDVYCTYCRPYYNINDQHRSFFVKLLDYFKIRKQVAIYNFNLKRKLLHVLQKGDRVFLMEYPGGSIYSQISYARIIKKKHPEILILGMFHLVPSLYESSFSKKQFSKICSNIDVCLTLGHSLSEYLINKHHIRRTNIVTLFHYVDSNYYCPINSKHSNLPIVIVMGNMKRNYKLLSQIVENTPNAHFIICQGRQDLSKYFKQMNNVELTSYIPEHDLKFLMNKADISLNVMDDTIGSNVIVTSMAMGLAMICSDVGSIRDYCGNDNAILCNNDNPKEFFEAIQLLIRNQDLLNKMKNASLSRAKRLSIEKFHYELQKSNKSASNQCV